MNQKPYHHGDSHQNQRNRADVFVTGEVLFDVYPEYRRLGGAPFNFASHLLAFGFATIFQSRVGDDENGREILSLAQKMGFDTSFIQKDETHETGWVKVVLDEDSVPDFTIMPDTAYDYIQYTEETDKALEESRLVYYGTLIQRTENGRKTVQRILKNIQPGSAAIYDVNLRKDSYTPDIIRDALPYCDILKLNDEELRLIKEMLGFGQGKEQFVAHLQKTFQISWVSLTSGKNGSTLYTEEKAYTAKPSSDIEYIDTVGAGDGYAAVLAMGYLLGWDPRDTIERATRFSAALCGISGAIPESSAFYHKFLDQWQVKQPHKPS